MRRNFELQEPSEARVPVCWFSRARCREKSLSPHWESGRVEERLLLLVCACTCDLGYFCQLQNSLVSWCGCFHRSKMLPHEINSKWRGTWVPHRRYLSKRRCEFVILGWDCRCLERRVVGSAWSPWGTEEDRRGLRSCAWNIRKPLIMSKTFWHPWAVFYKTRFPWIFWRSLHVWISEFLHARK